MTDALAGTALDRTEPKVCRGCDGTGYIDWEEHIFCFCKEGLRMWAEYQRERPIRDTGEVPKPKNGQMALWEER
jgi:hypothetical protein